jgi:hypothetical protein
MDPEVLITSIVFPSTTVLVFSLGLLCTNLTQPDLTKEVL